MSLDQVPNRLPIGIEVIDEKLNGGIRAGSIVLLSASPASQSEVLLSRLTHVRPTLYITTERTVRTVKKSLELSGAKTDNCTIVARDDVNEMTIDQVYDYIVSHDKSSTLVIDVINPLEEVESDRLLTFLNGIQTWLYETNSLGFFHALSGRNIPKNRDVTEYLSDVIFELTTDLQGEFIENRLYIPKVRGGKPVLDVIKIELSDDVTIDTSRDIA